MHEDEFVGCDGVVCGAGIVGSAGVVSSTGACRVGVGFEARQKGSGVKLVASKEVEDHLSTAWAFLASRTKSFLLRFLFYYL